VALLTILILVVDSLVGDTQALVERSIRFPLEDFLAKGVVGVASGHVLRCVEA